jgi:hypothetical protein
VLFAEYLCSNGEEPTFFGSLEAVTSVAPSDRIAGPVSVQALIDTGILSLIDLFLIEILLLRVRMSCLPQNTVGIQRSRPLVARIPILLCISARV